MNYRSIVGGLAMWSLIVSGCGADVVPVGPDPDCTCSPTGQGSGSSGAGGSDAGPVPPPETRLRAREVLTPDGFRAVVPDVYFDTLRSETCSFLAPAFGEPPRCLPEAVYPKLGYFADSACIVAIGVVDACEELPRYTTKSVQDSCYPTIESIHPLGPALAADATIYLKSGETCSAQGVVGAGNVALIIGGAIPWDEFETAEIVTVE
jgi:hypothetical protein